MTCRGEAGAGAGSATGEWSAYRPRRLGLLDPRPRLARVFGERSQRARWLFAGAAVVLVVLRSFVPTYYEGFDFDSDQAIVGLMARHLSSGQGFPLYYYGLNYLLGVEAWIIAPFFVFFRSSVALMRIPFVILNAIVAVWLMTELVRRLRLSQAMAFVAVLPFTIPTPAVGRELIGVAGACVEPFVYVLLLWRLRFRPVLFGMLLAFGALHREFTMFALPAIVFVEAASGELWVRANLRRAGWILFGLGLVWLLVDDLRMHLMGAGVSLQVASLGTQVSLDGTSMRRVASLVQQALPALFGGSGVSSPNVVDCLVVLALGAMVIRLVRKGHRPGPTNAEAGFAPYLLWIGLFTACVYPLSSNVEFGAPPLLRYLLFGLLIPVGLFAAFVVREQSRLWRMVVAGIFVLWAAVNVVDNAREVVSALRTPPVSEHRLLADYLTSRHIKYARAIYWDAYVVDFLSRERVVVTALDVVRIPEYQKQVDEHGKDAVRIKRQPCSGVVTVASWCLDRQ
jgi:hypothetical protein